MNNTAQNTVVSPSAAAKVKQITCGINQQEKELVKLLSAEFTRPAAVKGAEDVGASEREILEIALEIATERRFKVVQVEEEFLDIEENEFGELREFTNTRTVDKTVDLFEEKWEAIKARDYSTPGTRTNRVLEDTKSKLGAAQEMLAKLLEAQGMTPEQVAVELAKLA
jgi:hypothetical protein